MRSTARDRGSGSRMSPTGRRSSLRCANFTSGGNTRRLYGAGNRLPTLDSRLFGQVVERARDVRQTPLEETRRQSEADANVPRRLEKPSGHDERRIALQKVFGERLRADTHGHARKNNVASFRNEDVQA